MHKFTDAVVDFEDGKGTGEVEYQISFGNGDTVAFSGVTDAVLRHIDPPQWLPVYYPSGPSPVTAIGVFRWTRHDPAITKVYPDGLVTYTLTDVTSTQRWMSVTTKPDTTPLNQFTLPGTHDTGTSEMGETSQCQTMTLAEQLCRGIRFIDIRLEPVWNSAKNRYDLRIYHGTSGSDFTFADDIIEVCRVFLLRNPSETIVMLVNRNYNPFNSVPDKDFDAAANAIFAQYAKQYPDLFLNGPSMPSLAGARTHIVLVTRHANLPGIDCSSGWPEDTTGSLVTPDGLTLEIQDVYKFGGSTSSLQRKIDTKWGLVRDYLDKGLKPPSSTATWLVNYASATGDPGSQSPIDFAEGNGGTGVNTYLHAYLSQNPRGGYGAVIMDFPEYPADHALIRMLIDSNN
ncbi:phosphatidylinositol-specific phospholipase C domain-containing protein [Sphingomonas sp. MMS12-HWE2-04]|uniref:phosphatidylinositol-specific phospholipase C domain-containing protein n=1 Tax=Sphingomonas sp. MMS12-HWE2-04 TaxID=3234199 RepID=UPI00384C9649